MRTPSVAWILVAAALMTGAVGCDSDAEPEQQDERASAQQPLQPLIYTEHPNVDPEAVAVRERRLMRQLLEGADESGEWGDMRNRTRSDLPVISTKDVLGRSIFEALVERRPALWDRVFVAPVDYARMVHVDLDAAREYVDSVQAQSDDLWSKFEVEHASEAPSGGLESVFEYRGLELGEGRTLDGPIADDDEYVAQYWGNTLRIGLVDADVEFEVRIPKILRASNSVLGGSEPVLGIASPLSGESRFDVFLGAGLHLKPQLLETHEYPIPLKVGNFWRYRRRLAGASQASDTIERTAPSAGLLKREVDEEDGSQTRPVPDRGGLAATEALTEVVSVQRMGTRRLVHLRRSYNDAKLRTLNHYWMLTPRRIYFCNRACRRNVDDLGWMLVYMRRQTPIYVFPLEAGHRWTQAGRAASQDEATFSIDEDWVDVEVPAGSYDNALSIRGLGPYDDFDRYYRGHRLVRVFAYGEGVVRRRLEAEGRYEAAVVEDLVESRIMP